METSGATMPREATTWKAWSRTASSSTRHSKDNNAKASSQVEMRLCKAGPIAHVRYVARDGPRKVIASVACI
eukprot:5418273-Amphidinium_carterae.1